VYTEFFGLTDKPFAITPDPRYLYMSARHTDALAHLIYGISESGGFIQLTGEVGTGKTTLIRSLLEQLPEKADIALILSPQLTTLEFLQTIAQELHCLPAQERTVKSLIDALNAHLLRVHSEGRRVVLIVDEAQTLSPELLEQVRLLTNLETAKQKLLQIILIGQPELREILGRPEMRQIAQRITGRYHLEPLGRDDTSAYVLHRLRVAGAQSDIFTKSALRELYRQSRGIPRLINVIADRALLAGYTKDRRTVDGRLVELAAAEVFGTRVRRGLGWLVAAGVATAAVFVLATTNLWHTTDETVPSSDTALAEEVGSDPSPETPALENTENGFVETVAATSTTVEEERPPMTLVGLLEDPGFRVDPDSAIAELLKLWGVSYESGDGEPCLVAERHGLRCSFQTRGSVGELRRVNWPIVLSLVTEDGAEHPVVVASLGHDVANIVASGKTFELPLGELSYHWYGDYLLVWRPGNAPSRDLVPGMDDEGVLWLRETLAAIVGETSVGTSTRYDAALERRVRAYQRARKLTVDGIVGARTQIAMLADLRLPDTPLLVASH
jgi:general secretion pathway protein A